MIVFLCLEGSIIEYIVDVVRMGGVEVFRVVYRIVVGILIVRIFVRSWI